MKKFASALMGWIIPTNVTLWLAQQSTIGVGEPSVSDMEAINWWKETYGGSWLPCEIHARIVRRRARR